jgi:hypothetical protein
MLTAAPSSQPVSSSWNAPKTQTKNLHDVTEPCISQCPHRSSSARNPPYRQDDPRRPLDSGRTGTKKCLIQPRSAVRDTALPRECSFWDIWHGRMASDPLCARKDAVGTRPMARGCPAQVARGQVLNVWPSNFFHLIPFLMQIGAINHQVAQAYRPPRETRVKGLGAHHR